jgi:membrane-bound lytic murein transglycosylase MltF
MKQEPVLFTKLLIESIAEEHNISENKYKDFAKKFGITAALAGSLYAGRELSKDDSKLKTAVASKIASIKKEEPINHKEILMKQAYKESGFNPNAVSSRGAKGLTQIMPITLTDYLKSTGKKPEDVDLNDVEQSIDIQVKTMKDLYNATFIEKENQSEIVRMAKTLAAYNWGRGNTSSLLKKLKDRGFDIYNSLDWVKELPKETSDYINKILLQKDSKFNKDFEKAKKELSNKNIVNYYQKIKTLEK